MAAPPAAVLVSSILLLLLLLLVVILLPLLTGTGTDTGTLLAVGTDARAVTTICSNSN